MSADDDQAQAAEAEPPIWVPVDDRADPVATAAMPSPEGDAKLDLLQLRTGLPTSVLAGGAGVVVLAAAVVFGLIATRGPQASPDAKSPAAVSKPAATASEPVASPSTPLAALPTVSCEYVRTGEGPVPRRVNLPRSVGVVKGGRVDAQLATNRGEIVVSLAPGRTPCTVNSFLALARQRYFDDTSCHRLTTAGLHVLQCGDPGGTGSGGPGYSFADENLPAERTVPVTYPAGTVAMANGGPNTNGSQFFIVYRDTELLPTWTIFGQVSNGLDVVQRVAADGADPDGDGRPKQSITISSVTESISPQD